jgi:hypothetical protein
VYGRLLLLTRLCRGVRRRHVRNRVGLQWWSGARPSPSVSVVAHPVVANAPASAHPVPTLQAIERSLVVIGLAAPVSIDAPGSPSPPIAAMAGLVDQAPLAISDVELCSPLELDDEHLSPEVLMHIAYEVVSHLGRAEEFHLLFRDQLDL